MRCERFTEADIASFLVLAEGEGWLCDRWEFEFLLREFPQGCLVCRVGSSTVGYVTSISYGRSGWIGNLIVDPNARRHGIGSRLMKSALAVLLGSGVETVWLTASEQGAGLYRGLGFTQIDRINRWCGNGVVNPDAGTKDVGIEGVRPMDRIGWGDWRDPLLREVCSRGELYTGMTGFLCCQRWCSGTQIGPWGSLSAAEAGELLDRALTMGEGKVFLDVPSGNLESTALLSKRGFSISGSTILMYWGQPPAYHPRSIFALATMGSIG